MAKKQQTKNTKTQKKTKKTKEPVQEIEENSVQDNSEVNSQENVNEVEESNPKSRIGKVERVVEGMEITSGVIYASHLPWGFDESGIKKYFEQFGKVLRFYLPRSKRTGRIKGYAFIEFDSMEVAEIAAKTMNNYLLFEKIMKCEVIKDRARYNTIFKRWKRKFVFFDKYKNFLQERNKKKNVSEIKERVSMYLKKEEEKREKLKKMGIKYDFPGYKALLIEKTHKKIAKK